MWQGLRGNFALVIGNLIGRNPGKEPGEGTLLIRRFRVESPLHAGREGQVMSRFSLVRSLIAFAAFTGFALTPNPAFGQHGGHGGGGGGFHGGGGGGAGIP